MNNINIAIADDHPMIIGGLKNMLPAYPHIALTAAYENGKSLLDGLNINQPDVLLLDIQLPDKNGDELLPVIIKKYPEIKVLVITNINSTLYIYNMLRMGAKGYILKNAHPENIIRAIEDIYQGKEYLDRNLKEKLEQFTLKMRREAATRPSLTKKEKEVLYLTVHGHTIEEIAEKLFIAPRTVEFYRSNLFLKLEVRNMAELIKKSLEYGWTE